MECYKPISDAGGVPVLLMPLSFVVGMSMIKDIYEDYMRHKSDDEENSRKAVVAKKQKFDSTNCKNIRVGQIVKVHENEYFPCDLLVLNSSLPKGICYVETKNLDGETNLKHKQADKDILQFAQNDEDVMRHFNLTKIECDKQNDQIY